MPRQSHRRVARTTFKAGHVLTTVAMLAVSAVLITAAGLLFFLHLSVEPVLTGSMRPTFDPGSVLISRSIPVQEIKPGMIVIFVPPGHAASYAHRVLTVQGSPNHPVLTTKGDANPGPDPWHARINAQSIQQVVWSLPWFGRVMVAMHGPTLSAFLIVLAGVFIAITGARAIRQPRSSRVPRHLRPKTA
jgi:signal peptidase